MSQPGGTDRPPIPHAACSSSRLKGASWSTHSVLGGLRKSSVCLRAHSALKQTLDFETAPGTAGATTQRGEHCFPRQEPGWKPPHATFKAVAFSPLFSRQPAHTEKRADPCRAAGPCPALIQRGKGGSHDVHEPGAGKGDGNGGARSPRAWVLDRGRQAVLRRPPARANAAGRRC